MAGGAYNRLWDSFLPPKCLAAHSSDPGACLLPSLSYGFVDAPLFIIEAQVPVHPDSLVPMYMPMYMLMYMLMYVVMYVLVYVLVHVLIHVLVCSFAY
jgi:hypothetical protein